MVDHHHGANLGVSIQPLIEERSTKEQLRRQLTSGSLAESLEHRMLLGSFVLAADLPEADRLWTTITDWWPAIEVLASPA